MSKYIGKLINEPLLWITNPLLVECLLIPNVLYSLQVRFNSLLNANSLKQVFKLRGCPFQFIYRRIKQFLQKLYITKATQNSFNKNKLLNVLTFLGDLPFSVMKRVRSCIRNHIPNAAKLLKCV